MMVSGETNVGNWSISDNTIMDPYRQGGSVKVEFSFNNYVVDIGYGGDSRGSYDIGTIDVSVGNKTQTLVNAKIVIQDYEHGSDVSGPFMQITANDGTANIVGDMEDFRLDLYGDPQAFDFTGDSIPIDTSFVDNIHSQWLDIGVEYGYGRGIVNYDDRGNSLNASDFNYTVDVGNPDYVVFG